MKFTAVIAAVLSMAVVTIAAPVAVAEAEAQNHGMCVSSDGTTVTQITNC
ncbi:hypothetical protein P171DRAFT_485689 [Karstenula rhodostoma CBS 690.94]|uniref:Uncharacterized protein n=1 Tax=Karstenula rhodostoma CBS 690.94 TaxID=1392251 RepID=A0A9P4UA80_9PLEO|nr:hypothetical protein P171DRAFT_485689 [Karstenula rhodostoma CBS 690.94]